MNAGGEIYLSASIFSIPEIDLDHVFQHSSEAWSELANARLYITGASGFFGRWLIESLAWAMQNSGIQTEVMLLVRPQSEVAVRAKFSGILKSPVFGRNFSIHVSELKNFSRPAGSFTHLIHAAAETCKVLYDSSPVEMFENLVTGTREILNFAQSSGVKKFLYTSSGAVYGKAADAPDFFPETYEGKVSSLNPDFCYAEGKRAAEMLCVLFNKQYGMQTTIARGFAFAGPHLQLDSHFAICNFIKNALRKEAITIGGDGTAIRSYLYGADLAIWLLRILCRGQAGQAYNVGSDQALSVLELARKVDLIVGGQRGVHLRKKPTENSRADRYIPNLELVKQTLNLRQLITLEDSIHRSFNWWLQHKDSWLPAS